VQALDSKLNYCRGGFERASINERAEKLFYLLARSVQTLNLLLCFLL
jgi:hypothetical protein